MAEPVSLPDIKTHLRLDPDDVTEDPYLSALILAARRACELRINRSIVGASLTLSLDGFPEQHLAAQWPFRLPIEVPPENWRAIVLPGGTVSGVTSISFDAEKGGGSQTLDPGAYKLANAAVPAYVYPVAEWPDADGHPGSVLIAYDVSPMTPDDLAAVSHAIRLLVGGWYENRESQVLDVRGVPIELPLAVSWLLAPLRQWSTE